MANFRYFANGLIRQNGQNFDCKAHLKFSKELFKDGITLGRLNGQVTLQQPELHLTIFLSILCELVIIKH